MTSEEHSAKATIEGCKAEHSWDKPMDERRRQLIKVVMMMRYTFRGYFGLKFSNKWGFFVDRHMSGSIHAFSDWIEYPKGDHTLIQSGPSLYACGVSNDGCFLFTGSGEKCISVWDLVKQQMIHEWLAHDHLVQCIDLHSSCMVSGSYDCTLKIWNPFNYQLIRTLKGHSNYVMSAKFSNDGSRIVSGSFDNSMRVWSVKKGTCLRVLSGHELYVKAAWMGTFIVSASNDQFVKVWDSVTGEEDSAKQQELMQGCCDITVNCDGSLAAIAYASGLVVFQWPSMKETARIASRASRCEFHSCDPRMLAVSGNDHSVQLYDASNGRCLRILMAHSSGPDCICFSPDGHRMISVCSDGLLRSWDVSDLSVL